MNPEPLPSASAPSPESGSPGGSFPVVFGDYELLGEVARGGMGIVYRARHRRLNRIVALKMIRDSALASPKTLERFRLEAETAATLAHPNIVPIYEFGSLNGQWFLSMQLVEGADLSRHPSNVPMDPRPLARLMATMARAVHYAHQRGVLHRDLKPANILIDPAGEPHITDFGLAKFTDETGTAPHSLEIVGSPNFMAPEQLSGSTPQLTTAIDIYSLGAVMYQLLTGRIPFRSGTPLEVLNRVASEEPERPRDLYRFADRDLETICLKCLQKNPARRYGSAEALAEDLERWLSLRPILARPVTTVERALKWAQRNPWFASLVVLLHVVVIAALALGFWMSYRVAVAHRETELANVQLARNLRDLEWQKLDELIGSGKSAEAIAYLSRFLRQDPRDQAAATRLIDMLDRRNFVLPAGPALRHGASVNCLDLSRDGSRLLTGDNSGTARLWELAQGRLLATYPHGSRVVRASLVDEDRQVLTTAQDGSARLWDAATAALAFEFPHEAAIPENRVKSLLSADERFVALGETNGFVQVWDVQARTRIGPPLPTPHGLACAAFSPDGRRLAAGVGDKTVWVRDVATGHLIGSMVRPLVPYVVTFAPNNSLLAVASGEKVTLWEPDRNATRDLEQGEDYQVLTLEFTPDGNRIIVGRFNRPLTIHQTSTGKPVGARIASEGPFPYFRGSPDGLSLVTRAQNGVARLWSSVTGEALSEPFEHQGMITDALLPADHRSILTASQDGNAQLWSAQRRRVEPFLFATRDPQPAALFNARGDRVYLSMEEIAETRGDAVIVDTRTGRQVGRTMVHPGQVFRMALSPDGTRLASGGGNEARLWDAETGEPLTPPLPHRGIINEIQFSPDGRWVATASRDFTARLWNAQTGAPVGREIAHKEQVMDVRFRPDSRAVVTAGLDTVVQVWSVETGEPLWAEPIRHQAIVWTAEFSPDGRRIVTASTDRSARVWDAETGKPISRPMRHERSVFGAYFSPDGRRVLTHSEDGTARLWDATTGEPVSRPMRHGDKIWAARFSPDGLTVATGAEDNKARLWDARTGYLLSEPFPHPHHVTAVDFSRDGRRLLSVSKHGTLRIDELTLPPIPVPTWLCDLAEAVAGKRVDERGDAEPVKRQAFTTVLNPAAGAPPIPFYSDWAHTFLHDRFRSLGGSPSGAE